MASFRSRTFPWKGIACVLVLLLASGPVHAQSNSGNGSIYSRFGVGLLQDYSSSQSEALGKGGYALRSLNYNATANPALWSDQVYTRLSAGASYQRLNVTNGEGRSSEYNSGTVDAVQFSFPLYKRKLGVGLSFQPFSQHNYQAVKEGSTPIQVSPDSNVSVPHKVNFLGEGGLHRLRGGLGYRINDAISVGGSVDVLFGLIERERRTEFNQRGLRDVAVSDQVRLTGVSGSFGGHLSLVDLLTEEDVFSLGASIALPVSLNGSRTQVIGTSPSRDSLSSPTDGDLSLPFRSRLGVAYQPNDQWTITADGIYEPWSSFSSSFSNRTSFSQSFPVGQNTLTDRWRTSVGTEYLPAGEEQLSGYFSRTAYRLGSYVEQMYVRPDGETTLYTYAATGGVSLPTSLSGTRIDLNLTAGTRGATSGSLVRDTFYGVSLHVNFGEEWFQERKLR